MGMQQNFSQIYTDLSNKATPATAKSIKLLEANSNVKILSALKMLVDQSVSHVVLSKPDLDISQSSQSYLSTPAPQTPCQPVYRGTVQQSANRLTGSLGSQDTSQDSEHKCSQLQQKLDVGSQSSSPVPCYPLASPVGLPGVSMPAPSMLMTRLTVLSVGQKLGLSDAELDRDALAYVGNWARDMWLGLGKAELVQNESDGTWGRVTFTDSGRMRLSENACFKQWNRRFSEVVPEWSEKTLNNHRIRYSSAFNGNCEIGMSHLDDSWTYPATAFELLKNAFQQAKLKPRPS